MKITLFPETKQILIITSYLLLFVLALNVLTGIKNAFANQGVARFTEVLQKIILGNIISDNHILPNSPVEMTITSTTVASHFARAIFSLSYSIPLFALLLFSAILKISQIYLGFGLIWGVIPFILAIVLWNGRKKITDKYRKHLNAEIRKADVIGSNYNQLQRVKLFHSEKKHVESITKLLSVSSGTNRDLNREKDRIGYWGILFPCLVILYVMLFLMLSQEYKVKHLFEFGLWGIVYFYSTNGLKHIFLKFAEAAAAYSFLYDILEDERQPKDSPGETANFNSIQPIKRFEARYLKISFPGKLPIFSSVNFHAELGKLTILTGSLGSGKSILLSALSRLLSVSDGDILLNGQSWNSISNQKWRKMVSVMIQPVELFDTTVLENIGWGQEPLKKDEIVNFCRAKGFDQFFGKLPDGYNTFIMRGTGLSSGEKQLVALAAALYRKPQVLLLDEPAVYLDEGTTSFVFDLLQKLKQEMVVIVLTCDNRLANQGDYRFGIRSEKIYEY